MQWNGCSAKIVGLVFWPIEEEHKKIWRNIYKSPAIIPPPNIEIQTIDGFVWINDDQLYSNSPKNLTAIVG